MSKWCKAVQVTFFIIILLIAICTTTNPVNSNEKGKVIVLSIDGFEWEYFEKYDLTNFKNLSTQGSIGLVNPLTGGARNRDNAIFTMIMGKPTPAPYSANMIFHKDETYSHWPVDVFYRHITGTEYNGTIYHLGINSIKKIIGDDYGQFARLLQDNLINSMLVGLTSTDIKRTFANIIMDSHGVYQGKTLGLNEFYNKDELLLTTDLKYINKILHEEWSNQDVFFVEITDLMYVEQLQEWLTPELINDKKRLFLSNLDKWLVDIVDMIDLSKDLLIIFSPFPNSENASQKDYLTPIIIYGKNFEKSLLTSSTTKRAGLVANYDILSLILSHYHINESYGYGGLITTSSNGSVQQLIEQNNKFLVVYHQRPLIIKIYIFMQIVVITISLLTIIFKLPLKRFLKAALVILMIIPFSLLVTSVFNLSLAYIIITNSIVTSLLAYIVLIMEHRKKLTGFFILSSITSLFLLLDIWNNSFFIKQSILGYDPIAGARYYGIGNEYMGVLIGSSLLSLSLAIQLLRPNQFVEKISAVTFMGMLVTVFIGLPSLGTNVGGTIAAIAGFSFLIYSLLANRSNNYTSYIYPLLIPIIILGVLTTFATYDINRAVETQSHIGRTANLIRQEGITELWDIALRKINMNIKLIKYTNWSRVFLVLFGSIVLLIYKPPGLLAKQLTNNQGLKFGITSIACASFVALIANDSGIVAAATMMIYGAIPPIFLLLNQINN